MRKSVEEKSRIQEAPERTAREYGAESGLTEWIAKTVSERPLIGYGRSRYEQKRWQDSLRLPARRVEPRDDTSLATLMLQGTFYVSAETAGFGGQRRETGTAAPQGSDFRQKQEVER